MSEWKEIDRILDGLKHQDEFAKLYYDENKTQDEMCLEYLYRYGYITPWNALIAFKCFRLSAVIFRLRADGHNIRTDINDSGKRYAIYTLVEKGDEDNG